MSTEYKDYSHTRSKCSYLTMSIVITVTLLITIFLAYQLFTISDNPSVTVNEHEFKKGDPDYQKGLLQAQLISGILTLAFGGICVYFSTITILDKVKPKS